MVINVSRASNKGIEAHAPLIMNQIIFVFFKIEFFSLKKGPGDRPVFLMLNKKVSVLH